MKLFNYFCNILVFLLIVGQPAFTQRTENQNIAGNWEGTIIADAVKLRFVLRVTSAPDGTLSAKADSPDQAATDLPVDTITFKDGALHFEMKRLGASYDGKLNQDTVTGDFRQGPAIVPLTFKRVSAPIAVNRPQEPKPPYPYGEQEVAYENKRDSVKLAGTLTMPHGKGPFPAVLLITGSGAQDRNESVFGHKPFLVLADHLTRLGLAVLRVDDRGVGGSSGSVANSTSADFATDVLAGVEFLKARPEINAKQIGLVGHSEGGMIAPMVAAQSKDVAFIVLMAGPGLTGEEILFLQAALILKADGASPTDLAQQRAIQELIFKALKQSADNTIAEQMMRADLAKQTAAWTEAERKQAESLLNAQIKQVLTPWFRYILSYDPRAALRQVKCPVLALIGENDLQVPVEENLREIAAALKAGGNKDYTILRLPKLNHLFQTSTTGSPTEYQKIEETIAPLALKTIGDWLLKHTTPSK